MKSVQFGLCSIRIFFFFLYFLFLLIFFLTDTTDSHDYREGKGSPYFSCFPRPPAHEHSFSSLTFLPLLLNRSICNYQTTFVILLRDLHFICISMMQLSRSYWLCLTFQSDIVRIWAHIKLSPFYYKANTLTAIFCSNTAIYSINSNYLFSRTKQEKNRNNSFIKSTVYLLLFCQNSMIF